MGENKERKSLSFLGILGTGAFIFVICWILGWKKEDDFRLGVVTDEGIGIVAVSYDRKMASALKVESGMDIWIPGGLGWYPADRVAKIVKQEKAEKNLEKIFFYNFGFIPTKVVFLSKFEDWEKDRILFGNMGIVSWLRYKFENGRMFTLENVLDKKVTDREMFLDEIMPLEFADSKLLTGNLSLTVVNNTDKSGLATFLANQLDRAGFAVVGIENGEDGTEKCLFRYGQKAGESSDLKKLIDFLGCDKAEDKDLTDYEVELSLGEGLAQMIKYSNYVRTF